MQVLDGFSLDKINNSNFPIRTFRCLEEELSSAKEDLSANGWKVTQEKKSTLYGDMILTVKKKRLEQ